MTVAVAFRAIDPAIIEAFRDWQTARIEWGAKIMALADDLFPGHYPCVRYGFSSQQLCGIGWDTTTDGPVPDGWRMTKGRGKPTIVPKKNTKTGKTLAARLAEVGDLADPVLDGMLKEWWYPGDGHGFRIHYPSATVMGDDLYVTWSVVLEGKDGLNRDVDGIDLSKWEQLKLSEYHAVKEAHDAATVDA